MPLYLIKTKAIVLINLLLLITFNAQCQITVSLMDCYELLEKQNEDLKQANFRILLNEVEIKNSKNSFLPTLNFTAGHNYNLGLVFDQISGQLVTGNKWSNNANANINTRIPIFQNFSLRNRLKQSLLLKESSLLQRQQLLQSLKLQLLTKYIEAIANKSLFETSLKQLDFSKEQLAQEKEKLLIGTNTTIDIAQAESAVANNELIATNNLASYNSCLIEIKQLIGIDLKYTMSLQDMNVDSLVLSENIKDNDSSDILIDPVIEKAKIDIKQAVLNLKFAKAAYYPNISFFAGYGTNYSSEAKNFLTSNYLPFINQINQNRNLNFGISLNIPIFDAFKTKNNIKKLKLELNLKNSELSKIETEREKVLVLAKQEYQKSIKEYKFQLIQMSAQKKNLTAIKERYDIGISNAIEYNKALLDFNIAESNVIKSKYTILFNIKAIKVLTSNM